MPISSRTFKAKEIIESHFKIKSALSFLGKGSEGFVFFDKRNVYKIITKARITKAGITKAGITKSRQEVELYWTLLSLSETIQSDNEIKIIPKFEVHFLDNDILIKYQYEETRAFVENTEIHSDKFIKLLKQFRKIKWVLTDFKPQNLRITKKDDLLVIDIGKSFLPISNYLFESMCRRAFVTYKLQGKLSAAQDFKNYLSAVNVSADFSLMAKLGFSENKLKREFDEFYKKVTTVDKKELLNPVIKNIFQEHIKVKSVFDYGSGYGDISRLLKEIGLSVTAYEPNQEVIKQYKKKYYHNIDVLDYTETQNLIAEKTKFDSVLCSLVLCHPLAKMKQKRLKIIDKIMSDLTVLANKYIVMVVCNPLYTYQTCPDKTCSDKTCPTLQKRILPDNFNYKNETEFSKKIYSSGRQRFDIHRPLSFYEHLFDKYQLEITEFIQTGDTTQKNAIKNSDFMIFILKHSKS